MIGVLKTLLPKLSTLIKKEYKLQKGVRGEILFLKAELESMEAAILQISEAPIDEPPDRETQLWAREVRELSYDLEDAIDKFMVRIDGNPGNLHTFKGFIDRSMKLLTQIKIRHQLGTETRKIKGHIMQVSERRYRYKVDNCVVKPVMPSINALHLAALYRKETELIGIENKSSDLIKRLMGENEAPDEQLKIISITGFGGLGKTTVANVVYKSLKDEFDCGAFVSVSQNPKMEKVFQDMLREFDEDQYKSIRMASLDEAQLINEMRKYLLYKRYLIVVDDIWDTSVWESIKFALIDNANGSRVITTTRNLHVAKEIGGAYTLEPLSKVDARKLFHLRLFGKTDKFPPDELLDVSENILKKCGGFPLAIITIASMLSSKRGLDSTYSYWSKVYQSMGRGLKDDPDLMKMRKILSVSYHDLPAHLKNCLLLLSSYPEDHSIGVDELIWNWAAQGFIFEEEGKSLHRVGEDYVAQLINRNFIQVKDVYTGKQETKLCTVHDMVLDLVVYLSQEQNFLITLGGHQLPEKVHRLVIRNDAGNIRNFGTMNLISLRSLKVSEEAFHFLPALSRFPVLRSLDLSYCMQVDNRAFKVICELFHLRCLRLYRTSITKVPKQIRNLCFLQILDIAGNIFIDNQLPSTFIHLRQLFFLHVPEGTKLPAGLENLELLQELGSVLVRSTGMLHNLGKLTKLRSLSINLETWNDNYVEPFRQCLYNLACLEFLDVDLRGIVDLSWHQTCPMLQQLHTLNLSVDSSWIAAAPSWLASIYSLSVLNISLQTLGSADIQVLGSMPSLRLLVIIVQESTQGRDRKLIIEKSHNFCCLKRLSIFCRHSLEVGFAPGALQNLERLYIDFSLEKTMVQFGEIEFGLQNLSSLVKCSVLLLTLESSMPYLLSAAEDKLYAAISMNPNKPRLKLQVIKRN